MKRTIQITLLILGTALSTFAQYGDVRGSNQEAFFGVTAGYGFVKLAPTPEPRLIAGPDAVDRKAYTYGVTLGYTFYFKKDKSVKSNVLGIGMDVNAQFHDAHPVTGTVMAGLVYKTRFDKRVQPFARVMAGGARLGFKHAFANGVGLVSTAKRSPAALVGVGFDVAKKDSRFKWRVGVDYVRTAFADRTQNFARGTTGVVF